MNMNYQRHTTKQRRAKKRYAIKKDTTPPPPFYLLFITPEIISHLAGVLSGRAKSEALLSTSSLLRTSKPVKDHFTKCLEVLHQMKLSDWFLLQRREMFLDYLSSRGTDLVDVDMTYLSSKMPFDLIVKYKDLSWNWLTIQKRSGSSTIIKQIEREWNWKFDLPHLWKNLEELVENFHSIIENDVWSRISSYVSCKFIVSHLGDEYKWDLNQIAASKTVDPQEYIILSKYGVPFVPQIVSRVTDNAESQFIFSNADCDWNWIEVFRDNVKVMYFLAMKDDKKHDILTSISKNPKYEQNTWSQITYCMPFEFILAYPEFPWFVKRRHGLTEQCVEAALDLGIAIDLLICAMFFSYKLIVKHPNLNWDWKYITKHHANSPTEIEKLIEINVPLDYKYLSDVLNLDIIFRFPDRAWDGVIISRRVKKFCDVENNPQIKWNWVILSSTDSIIPYIEQYPDRPWNFGSAKLLDYIVDNNLVRICIGKDVYWSYLSSICYERDVVSYPDAPWDKKELFLNARISDKYICETRSQKWGFSDISKRYPARLIRRKKVLFKIPRYAWNFEDMSRCDSISQNLDIITYFIDRNWDWDALSSRVPLWYALEHRDKPWNWSAFSHIPIEVCFDLHLKKISSVTVISKLF